VKAVRIIVSGKVQGVFFRKHTKNTADKLGVKGFVQNMHSNTVYIEAEANEETLQQFIEWCKQGSPSSSVEKVIVSELTSIGFKQFIIRHGDTF
jgi:acylphosphatase